MSWYLIHTKPRQEERALQNLHNQGFHCYLPTLQAEHLRRGKVQLCTEPLFPRYLFIQLNQGDAVQDWSPIRSTLGVSKLVRFGDEPAQVEDALIAFLKRQEESMKQPERLFTPGDRVQLTEGPFAGFEGIYQMQNGDQRALVLIEFLNKPVKVPAVLARLRKLA